MKVGKLLFRSQVDYELVNLCSGMKLSCAFLMGGNRLLSPPSTDWSRHITV